MSPTGEWSHGPVVHGTNGSRGPPAARALSEHPVADAEVVEGDDRPARLLAAPDVGRPDPTGADGKPRF